MGVDSVSYHRARKAGIEVPIRRKQISTCVEKLLRDGNITEPPVPVETIAKEQGLVILFERLDSDLSGFVSGPEHGSIIGVNTSHPKVRQRFTIAHELGHYLLHQTTNLHVDRSFLMKRTELSSQGTDDDEIEANAFAAELLMPRDLLATDLKNVGDLDLADDSVISDLARRYRVSTQALLLRLINLGYVDQP